MALSISGLVVRCPIPPLPPPIRYSSCTTQISTGYGGNGIQVPRDKVRTHHWSERKRLWILGPTPNLKPGISRLWATATLKPRSTVDAQEFWNFDRLFSKGRGRTL